MSQPKFVLKRYESENYADIKSKIADFEAEWLTSLLVRCSIPKVMIDKALADPTYSKLDWRDFLFKQAGLFIVKDIGMASLSVKRVDEETGAVIVVGSWSKPEIVRIADEGKLRFQLNLKYWQIA